MFKLLKKTDTQKMEITISNRTVLRAVLVVFAAILFLGAIRQAATPLLLIVSAFFLALALNAPVHWIATHLPGKLRGGRTAATAIAFLLVIIFLGLFIASVIPPLIRQTQSFVSAAPGLISDLRDTNSPLGGFIERYSLQEEISDFTSQLGDKLRTSSGTVVSGISRVGSSILAIVTILALTIMMLLEGPRLLAFLRERLYAAAT